MLGESHVLDGHAFAVVGRQLDVDSVVDVEPFRMVVLRVNERDARRHKGPGNVKVFENEAALNVGNRGRGRGGLRGGGFPCCRDQRGIRQRHRWTT